MLGADVETAVGIGDRSLPHALVFPRDRAILDRHADEAAGIGGAVDVVLEADHAAVVNLHVLVGVDFLTLEVAVGFADLEGVATDAVTGGDEDQIAVDDRRGNHGGFAFSLGFPENLAIGRDA